MRSRRLWTAGLAALFIGAVGAPAGGSVKVASTPEEAVRFVAEARKAGDMGGVLAQVAEPNRSALEWVTKAGQAYDAYQAALNKKFGDGPFGPLPLPAAGESMKWTTSIVVVKKQVRGKGQVELTVWETNKVFRGVMEEQWTAVKVGNGWKLLLPVSARGSGEPVHKQGPDGKMVEVVQVVSDDAISPKVTTYVKEVMPKYLAMMQGLTKGVEEGKYKTRKEAEQAIARAQEAFFREHPEPELKKSAK